MSVVAVINKEFTFCFKRSGPSNCWRYVKIRFIVIIFALTACIWANDSSYIVIFAGGKTKADAINAVNKWESSSIKKELPQITPVALLSDTIEGLNPGFHIAVAGSYLNKNIAMNIRDEVNTFFKGTYIRKVANIKNNEKLNNENDFNTLDIYSWEFDEGLYRGNVIGKMITNTIEGFDNYSNDTDFTFQAIKIDYDNDGEKDLVVLSRFRLGCYKNFNDIYFYKKQDSAYKKQQTISLNKTVLSKRFQISIYPIFSDEDNVIFQIYSKDGGSGGGHTLINLFLKDNRYFVSKELDTGKYINYYDIDKDGNKEYVVTNYGSSEPSVYENYLFYNGKYYASIYKFVDGSFVDISDQFRDYKSAIINLL